MFASVVLAAAMGVPACWDIFDAALRRSAAAAHPAYISYNERIVVTADNQPLLYSSAHVDYRDDGVARVEDERFDYRPYLTRYAEPGPPELGPYGPGRLSWIPHETDGYPVIANVRSEGNVRCELADVENYKGYLTYHLIFLHTAGDKPTVKEMWVDTTSRDIWKLIVSGPVYFMDANTAALTDFQVELKYVGPYLVVDHVVWEYHRREYSQSANFFGEYTLGGYRLSADAAGIVFQRSRRRLAALVGHPGLEPGTSCLSSMRSNQLS